MLRIAAPIKSRDSNKSQILRIAAPIKIWTDGACSNNGRINPKAGYGVYFENNRFPPISKRLKGKQTNQCAEMYAVYAALKRLYYHCQPCHVHFYIDNENALNTLLTTRKSGDNWNIIAKLYHVRDILLKRGFKITGEWVKGHGTSKENDLVDKLAKAGARKAPRKGEIK